MITRKILEKITIDVAPVTSGRICYMILPFHPKEKELKWLEGLSSKYNCTMVAIAGVSWDHDMTPWEAPDVGKSSRMLKGRSVAFLRKFREVLLPIAEEGLQIEERFLAGVSLSGLFALWAASECDDFSRIASVSGSLWYDNFVEWLSGASLAPVERFYLSLGDQEKHTSDPRIATVEERTLETIRILREKGIEVIFEMNPGSHYVAMYPRMEKAMDALMKPKVEQC